MSVCLLVECGVILSIVHGDIINRSFPQLVPLITGRGGGWFDLSAGQVLPITENQQDRSCLLPKFSRTSLAYYRFAFANEQEGENRQKKRKSAREVFPITVLRTQVSKKQKSAGQVLPITVLRSSWETVISNTVMGFRTYTISAELKRVGNGIFYSSWPLFHLIILSTFNAL